MVYKQVPGQAPKPDRETLSRKTKSIVLQSNLDGLLLRFLYNSLNGLGLTELRGRSYNSSADEKASPNIIRSKEHCFG